MIIGISGHIGSGKDLVGKIIQYLLLKKENKDSIWSKDAYFGDHPTAAQWLDTYSDWKIKKFTDKLKDIVCIIIDCTREQLEDREFKEKELGEEWWYVKLCNSEKYKLITVQEYKEYIKGTTYIFNESDIIKPTPRLLLQLLGTECGRQIIHPQIWVNSLMSEYNGVICSKKESNDFVLAGEEKIYVKYPNWIITDVRFPNEVKAIKDRGGILIRIERDYILTGEPEDPKIQHESETALDNHQNWNYVIENNTDIVGLIQKIKDILLFEGIIKEKL